MGHVTLDFLGSQLELAEQLNAGREHLTQVHAGYLSEFDRLVQQAREEAEGTP